MTQERLDDVSAPFNDVDRVQVPTLTAKLPESSGNGGRIGRCAIGGRIQRIKLVGETGFGRDIVVGDDLVNFHMVTIYAVRFHGSINRLDNPHLFRHTIRFIVLPSLAAGDLRAVIFNVLRSLPWWSIGERGDDLTANDDAFCNP